MRIPNRGPRRAGFISSFEFMLYVPLLILTLIAVVQFSQVLAADARLSGASREGARVAASGGNGTQITNAVYAVLLPAERSLAIIQSNAVDANGNPAGLTPGVDVVVRVSMMTNNVVAHPLPFVIAYNQELVGQTVMRKE
jgi:Flp pilus assembly protein TadG